MISNSVSNNNNNNNNNNSNSPSLLHVALLDSSPLAATLNLFSVMTLRLSLCAVPRAIPLGALRLELEK